MTSVADQDWFRAPGLTRVLDLLNHDGEARVVGGAVRNSLMGIRAGRSPQKPGEAEPDRRIG